MLIYTFSKLHLYYIQINDKNLLLIKIVRPIPYANHLLEFSNLQTVTVYC